MDAENYPKAKEIFRRDELSDSEIENLVSFIVTQLEQVTNADGLVIESPFVTALQNKETDIAILREMLDDTASLNQCVKYFKKIKINANTTINSVEDTRSTRDNSHVLVEQQIDLNQRQVDTDMVERNFYYRINYFFEFSFGHSKFILANANELIVSTVLPTDLNLKGIQSLFKMTHSLDVSLRASSCVLLADNIKYPVGILTIKKGLGLEANDPEMNIIIDVEVPVAFYDEGQED